jgi:hypothetical protein
VASGGADTSEGAGYAWWPAVGLNRTDTATVVAMPQTTTTYFVEVARGECRDTASVTVTVVPPPQAQVSGDTSICLGLTATLVASDGAGTTGGAGYTWWPADGLDRTDTATVVAMPPATTTYFVEVARGECRDTASVTVNIVSPERVLLRHGSAAGAVGTTVETDLVVEAGAAIEVRIDNPQPLARLVAIDGRNVPPQTTAMAIDLGMLAPGTHRLQWLLFLAAPTTRSVAPSTAVQPCREVEAIAGEIAIDGCAITRRIVALGAMATIGVDVVGRAVTASINGSGSTGAGAAGTAAIFDLAGRAMATAAVNHGSTAMLPVPHAGVYIVRVRTTHGVVDVPVMVE